MTNFEKIKELQPYEASQVIFFLNQHVQAELIESGAEDNLDASDHLEASFEISIDWLNEPYDEDKGFKFIDYGEPNYITIKDLQNYDYLK